MSLNGLQLHLKSLLDGLTLPFAQEATLRAYVNPPNPGDEDTPVCFIWGSVGDESRRAAPRAAPGNPATGGRKKELWQVDVWLYYAEASDDPNADSLFPVVIDTIKATLRNTPMPVENLTDPVTGAVFTLLQIGEQMKTDYAPVRALADQRYVQYEARIIVTVEESYQA